MPSANISGRPSSTNPDHIECDFGVNFPVLDGGKAQKGVESTILGYFNSEWCLLREGAIPREAFLPILHYLPRDKLGAKGQPLSPGQMFKHYAPKAVLHLTLPEKTSSAALVLGFKERDYDCTTLILGAIDSPEEVAMNLYDALREIDKRGVTEAYVDMDFPEEGLWRTIRERLNRAAAR